MSKQRDASTNLKRAVTRSPVSLALVLGMVVSAGGCSCGTVPLHIPSSTAITVPGHGIDIGRPLDPNEVFPTDVIGDALATELSQSLDTSGYPKDTVTSLKLTKMTLTVTDPEENGRALRGLGCLESLAFFIGDGDLREQAAYAKEGAFDGDPGPATYDMELTGNELAPALKAKDQLTVDAEVTPSEQPTFDTEVVFDFELTAEVDPLLVAQ